MWKKWQMDKSCWRNIPKNDSTMGCLKIRDYEYISPMKLVTFG